MFNDEYDPLEPKNRHIGCNRTECGEQHREPCSASASRSGKYYSLSVISDADGTHSPRGAKGCSYAVEAFCQCVAEEDFVRGLDTADTRAQLQPLLESLAKKVTERWCATVERDLDESPLTAYETCLMQDFATPTGKHAYSAGLLGFVCGRRWCFGLRIGSGRCTVFNKWGQVSDPIPRGRGSASSLSDENAAAGAELWFEYFYEKDFPIAVFLTGDNTADALDGTGGLHTHYLKALGHLSENSGEQSVADVEGALSEISESLVGTDVSLGMILNRSAIASDPYRWEGTGRRIYVDNSGDMDQDSYERYYSNKTMIPAETGSYSVPVGRGGSCSVDVLSADESSVRLRFRSKEYELTRDVKLHVESSEDQPTYSGSWHTATDDTYFTLL